MSVPSEASAIAGPFPSDASVVSLIGVRKISKSFFSTEIFSPYARAFSAALPDHELENTMYLSYTYSAPATTAKSLSGTNVTYAAARECFVAGSVTSVAGRSDFEETDVSVAATGAFEARTSLA